ANYCPPLNIINSNVYYISNVKLGSINKSSSGSTGGYSNYSSELVTEVTAGEIITGTVSVNLNGWNVNTNTVVVWINFNENADDDFNDNGERFIFPVIDNRNVSENKVVQVPISIPIPDYIQPGFT